MSQDAGRGEFTPGPWVARRQTTVRGEAVGWIVETSHRGCSRIGWASLAWADTNEGAPHDHPENVANAHLIAAAPSLYEALVDVLADYREHHGAFPHRIAKADAALALARGESPSSPASVDPSGQQGDTKLTDAGREMDERIAVEVMGATWTTDAAAWGYINDTEVLVLNGRDIGWRADDVPDKGPGMWKLPHYSTDRTAALEVVDRLTESGCDVTLYFYSDEQPSVEAPHGWARVHGDAPSLPLAICRAALHPEVLAHLNRTLPESSVSGPSGSGQEGD